MKKKIDRRIAAVVIAIGISSVVTQLLVIREFLSQFNGNEFVIALILFLWLFLGGIGTFAAKVSGKRATPIRLAWVAIGLAILSPAELLGVRLLRNAVFIYGSSVGFYPTLFFSFAVILPYCLLAGFALPYSLVVARNLNPDFPGIRIYILDNIGDVLGGLLFSFVLVILVTPLQAILIAHLLLIAAAVWMYALSGKSLFPAAMAATMAFTILIAGIAEEKSSLAPAGMNMVYYKESRYGRIQVFKDQTQYTLFLDGKPIFSNQNLDVAEETVHYGLAQLDHVSNILMISAEAGVINEIEKYHPSSIDYVEIDPAVSDALFRFGLIEQIPGLRVIHQDGRAYLRQTDKQYDAIFLNLPEPDTFQINRFYTDQFFHLAKKHLAPGGILSFSIEGFDNYLSPAQADKMSSLYRTARQSFARVLLLPGQRIFFICRDSVLQTDIPKLLEQKKIRTLYIKGFYYGNISEERIGYLHDQIKANAPINTDYSPHLIRLMYRDWFYKFSSSPTPFIVGLMLVLAAYLLFVSKEEFLLFSTGFTIMGSEILVIFVFQICFGYIYQQIGMIVTVFLAGLFPGAIFGEAIRKRGRRVLLATDVALMLLMTAFIAAIVLFGNHLTPWVFMVFGFVLSVACGCQFPVALHLRGSGKQAVIEIFSADLIGASFGTLIISIILIPYLGIIGSAASLIIFKTISFIITKTGHEIVI